MNMNQWLTDLLARPDKKPFPVLSYPAVQFMDSTVKDIVPDGELQARCMKLVAEKTDSLASVSFMDLSVEAECFGAEVRYTQNEVPTVIGALVTDMDEAEALKVPAVGSGRSGVYIEAIQKAKELICDRPVFAGAIGPFSLAGRLVDVTEAMILCFEDPDMLKVVLDKATEFIIQYVKAFKKAGADGVVLAEPLAGMLSPKLCDEFSSVYVKKIREAVEDDSFLMIYHNCGNGTPYMTDSLLSTGVKAMHFGDAVDMESILKLLPADVVAMGNISPSQQFVKGTPDSIREATLTLLRKMSGYRNFVLSSGCDIPPHASWDNIFAFFKAYDEFNRA